jgi:hypothetical protein
VKVKSSEILETTQKGEEEEQLRCEVEQVERGRSRFEVEKKGQG